MDLEHVSVENSEYREHYYPPEPNKSTTFSPKETRSEKDMGTFFTFKV